MKPNLYAIVSRCVADGIHQGINTSYDKCANPPKIDERVREEIHTKVMRELSEYFDWEDTDK